MSDANYSDTLNVKGINSDGTVVLLRDQDKFVEFYEKIDPNSTALEPKMVVYCKIMNPGEPLNVWDQPVRQVDKMRFRQQWAAFEAGKRQQVDGTPLNQLFPGNLGAVKVLEAQNIGTVEQLATLSDTAVQGLQFGHDLRERAKKFMAVKRHQDQARERELAEAQRTAVAGMADEMKAMRAELEALRNKPKPGRPKKVAVPQVAQEGTQP